MGILAYGVLKLNIDGSIQDWKAGTRFVIRNNIGILIGAGSVPLSFILHLKLRLGVAWASNTFLGQWLVLEGMYSVSLPRFKMGSVDL